MLCTCVPLSRHFPAAACGARDARGRAASMLFSCAVYISSGVSSVATRVAAAARAATPSVAVVDTFTDVAYARSSVKLVAEAEPLLNAAEAAAAEALSLIDLSKGEIRAIHTKRPSPTPWSLKLRLMSA